MLSGVDIGGLMPESDRKLPEPGSPAETQREAEVEGQLGLIASAATDQQPLLARENDPVTDPNQSIAEPEE
jgi:hypothetical protein